MTGIDGAAACTPATAAARSFEHMDQALAYLDEQPVPIVVKADGLAAGKGVIIRPENVPAFGQTHCVVRVAGAAPVKMAQPAEQETAA